MAQLSHQLRRHPRAGGDPAAGSPARMNCLLHRRRGALDSRFHGNDVVGVEIPNPHPPPIVTLGLDPRVHDPPSRLDEGRVSPNLPAPHAHLWPPLHRMGTRVKPEYDDRGVTMAGMATRWGGMNTAPHKTYRRPSNPAYPHPTFSHHRRRRDERPGWKGTGFLGGRLREGQNCAATSLPPLAGVPGKPGGDGPQRFKSTGHAKNPGCMRRCMSHLF